MNAQVTTRDAARRETFWTVGYFCMLGLGACVGWFLPEIYTAHILRKVQRQQEQRQPTEVFVAASDDRMEHGR